MPTPKKVGTDSHQNAEAKLEMIRSPRRIWDPGRPARPGRGFDRELQDQLKAQRQAEREARALEEAESARG